MDINWVVANSWITLGIAIIFGVLGTISMKLSHGLSRFWPMVSLGICYGISFIALTFTMKHIPISIVYAVWSGVGTVLVATIGMIHFKESVSAKKIFFLMLIVIGIIGIH
jgi:small multidrug resistance pump